MKILIAILVLASLLASGVAYADLPLDCDPEDRVIPGNTNSDCRWDYRLDEIQEVRFVVLEQDGMDACYGALAFHPYDIKDIHPDTSTLRMVYIAINGDWEHVEWSLRDKSLPFPFDSHENSLLIPGHMYGLDSPITGKWLPNTYALGYTPYILPNAQAVQLVTYADGFSIKHASRKLPLPPEVNDFPVMLNDCLAGVKLRLEAETQAEQDRAKLVSKELDRDQALSAEKSKAEVDANRLLAAQKALQIQQEIELTKTRSLIARLERDKIIIGIWNDIVLERLRGFKGRANITNKYLAEIEANLSVFSTKVREKYEELKRLEELNQAIADAISAHNAEIQAQLAAAAELEAQNMEKLDGLTTPDTAPTTEP